MVEKKVFKNSDKRESYRSANFENYKHRGYSAGDPLTFLPQGARATHYTLLFLLPPSDLPLPLPQSERAAQREECTNWRQFRAQKVERRLNTCAFSAQRTTNFARANLHANIEIAPLILKFCTADLPIFLNIKN